MLAVSVGEAKNRLPYFLHLVEEKNETVQITRHGKVVAYLNNKDEVEDSDSQFMTDLNTWKNKYRDINFDDTEITRSKEVFAIRHPEDF